MTDKHNNDITYVGFLAPSELNSYLALFCLGTGAKKSSILRERLLIWKKAQQEKMPEEELLKKVIQKKQKEWNAKKAELKENSAFKTETLDTAFEIFKFETKTDLCPKIPTHIETILTQLKR